MRGEARSAEAETGLCDFPRLVLGLVRSKSMNGPHPAFESLTSRTFGKSSIHFAFTVKSEADPSRLPYAESRPVLILARPATCQVGRYVVHQAFRERLPH